MMSPEIFLKVGFFLPSVVLVSAAMVFGGLWLWVDSGWRLSEIEPSHAIKKDRPTIVRKWLRRRRPVLPILSVMISTHVLGLALFCLANRPWVIDNRKVRHQHFQSVLHIHDLASLKITFPLLFSTLAIVPLAIPFAMRVPETGSAPPSQLLHALNLCLASTVISILAVLNFSLAATTSVLLGLPLSFAYAPRLRWLRIIKYMLYVFLGFGWLLIGHEEAREALWYWEILRGWFAPFICIVYGPLAWQAGIVSLL
jgi:glycosylphosphatidylinositol transamidase